jgi:hypothetical protein
MEYLSTADEKKLPFVNASLRIGSNIVVSGGPSISKIAWKKDTPMFKGRTVPVADLVPPDDSTTDPPVLPVANAPKLMF